MADQEEINEDVEEEVEDEQELPAERRERITHNKKLVEEQNRVVLKGKNIHNAARKAFLGGLTEILDHFMNPEAQSARPKKKAPGTPNKRTRKDEAEEDKEMLQVAAAADEEEAEDTIRISESPSWIKGGQMRDYQIDGLNWMIQLYENGVNGILADEMGLGKTLETISLLGYMKNVLGMSGPHLVVVPNSTLANWQKEFVRWCPSLRSFIFHGDKEKRAHLKDHVLVAGQFDVCITSYEMILRELTAINKFCWRYLVIDEAHRIKNEASKLAEAVRAIKANNRLLLTGTPLQNNLHELWALLNFLMPDLFEHSNTFDKWFSKAKSDDAAAQQGTVSQLHKLLKPFLLRRVKADVEKSLLPKMEIKVFVGLMKAQKELYKKVLLKDIEAVNGVAAGNAGKNRLHNIAMQLRKVCNHPYLFEGVEAGPPFVEGEHLVVNSGKLVVLDKLLKKLKLNGSRVLIFSQMTRMLDIIEDYLDYRGYLFCRIDGNTPQEEREQQIEEFNAPNSKKFCFLLSTRAGGLGINLATADTVVLFDSDWNPQMDLQAMDRAHRIGQKKQVMVYRLVMQDTIEQKIVERAEAKLYLDALIIQQGRLVEKHQNASSSELLQMVKFGADTIFQGGADSDYQLTDADIDSIIALGKKKGEEFSEKLKSANLSLANFSLEGLTAASNLYEHDGQDFSALQRQRNLLTSWIAPPKRETKVSTYNENVLLNPNQKQRVRVAGPPTRPPRQHVILPHQFLPEGLSELFEIETKRYIAEYHLKVAEAKSAADPEEKSLKKEADDLRKKLPPALTSENEAERDRLLARGFPEWKRPEFQGFMRGMELHGRDAIAEIAGEVGLPEEAVRTYHTAFWKLHKTLPDWEKLVSRVERGEKRRENQKGAIDLLKTHFSNIDAEKSTQLMELIGGSSSYAQDWTPDHDFWLLMNANQVGYGNWTRLQRRVAEHSAFAMDWFMLSRTSEDLQERVDKLLKSLFEKAKRQATSPSSGVEKKKRGRKRMERPGEEAGSAAAEKPAGPAPEKPKRVKKDKGPKKSLTAYKHFQKEMRDELKESQPALTPAEVTKQAGEAWKTKTPEERKKYEDLAEADAERYERELEQWDKEQAAKPKAPPAGPSPGKKGKATAAELAKTLGPAPAPPTKPKNGYLLYQQEKRPELKVQTPNASGAELLKALAAGWKALPEDEKKKFHDRVELQKLQFAKDMAAWRKQYPAHAKQMDLAKAEKKDASKKKRDAKKAATAKVAAAPGAAAAAPKQTVLKPLKAAPKARSAPKAKAPAAGAAAKRETTVPAEKPGATKKSKQ